jgi:hypothetical protein
LPHARAKTQVGIEASLTAAQKEEELYGIRLIKRVKADQVALPADVLLSAKGMQRSWEARLHARFSALTKTEAKAVAASAVRLSNATKAALPRVRRPTREEAAALPASVDLREHGACGAGGYEAHDQGLCGSGFAFAAAVVYSKRLCQASYASADVALSAQDLTSCYVHHDDVSVDANGDVFATAKGVEGDGCNGGNALSAWLSMQQRGSVAEQFNPYVAQGRSAHPCGDRTYDNPLLFKVEPGWLRPPLLPLARSHHADVGYAARQSVRARDGPLALPSDH